MTIQTAPTNGAAHDPLALFGLRERTFPVREPHGVLDFKDDHDQRQVLQISRKAPTRHKLEKLQPDPRNDTLTFLRVAQGKRTAKLIDVAADGSVQIGEYDAGLFVHQIVEIEIANVFELAFWLEDQSQDPELMLIRGEPLPEIEPPCLRRSEHEPVAFRERPRRWVMLDLDGKVQLGNHDLVNAPELAVAEYVSHLPDYFSRSSYVWQLSGTALFRGTRLHTFHWLDRHVTKDELKSALRGFNVDVAVFRDVQPCYVSKPIIRGIADPLPRRWGIIRGETDEVTFPLPAVSVSVPAAGAFPLPSTMGDDRAAAVAALLGPLWPQKDDRHNSHAALAGGLLADGVTDEVAIEILCAVAVAADPENERRDKRESIVFHTREQLEAMKLDPKKEIVSWGTLVELLRKYNKNVYVPGVVERVQELVRPATVIVVEQLADFAKELKKKTKNPNSAANTRAALGIQLAKALESRPLEKTLVEQLAKTVGAKFFDCDLDSIVEKLESSIKVTLGVKLDDVRTWIQNAQQSERHARTRKTNGGGGSNGNGNGVGAIEIEPDPVKMADIAEQVLAKVGGFVQHGNALSRVVHARRPVERLVSESDSPVLQLAPADAVREALGRAFWFTTEEGKAKKVLPPDWVVRTLGSRVNWPSLPNVEFIAESPFLRRDGSVCSTQGYDARSGAYVALNAFYPEVPEYPTEEQAQRAIAEIDHVICQFPFAKAEHRSGFFALVLSLCGSELYPGPTPLVMIEASSKGSGKDKAARTACIIGTGHAPYSAQFDESEKETRKLITSVAIAGIRCVLFGNVVGTFGNGPLCDALTTELWSDRVLGVSEMWSGRLKTIWLATANAPVIGPDMDRRILPVRLDWGQHGVTKPWELPDSYWRVGDPVAYALANRPRLCVAALTIWRRYIAAGCPDMRASSWGSYEPWARTVIGCLKYNGLPDPGPARQEFAERADHGGNLEVQFIRGFTKLCVLTDPNGVGLLASAIASKMSGVVDAEGQELRSATDALTETPSLGFATGINSRALGKLLSRLENKLVEIAPIFENGPRLKVRVIKRGKDRQDRVLWGVECIQN